MLIDFIKRFIYLGAMFIFVLVLFTAYGFYTVIKPAKITSSITPESYDLNYEEISFETKDELTLSGWYIPNDDAEAKTIIALHGYPASKGDVLPAVVFLSTDYHLMLFDFRYFGESEGEYSTVGGHEVRDLQAAIDYLNEEKDVEEVGVWGFSFGGAVGLMGAVDIPEIKTVVSQSSFASLDSLANDLYQMPALSYPLGRLTGLWAQLFLEFNIMDVSPADSSAELDIPVFIIHSKNDDEIGFENAELIEEALVDNDQAEFWFYEGYSHNEFPEDYQDRVAEFFEVNL